MRDADIVEVLDVAQYFLLLPGRMITQYFERTVGIDSHNNLVKALGVEFAGLRVGILEFNDDIALLTLQNGRHFCAKENSDALLFQILSPCIIDVVERRECAHRGDVGEKRVGRVLEQTHARIQE